MACQHSSADSAIARRLTRVMSNDGVEYACEVARSLWTTACCGGDTDGAQNVEQVWCVLLDKFTPASQAHVLRDWMINKDVVDALRGASDGGHAATVEYILCRAEAMWPVLPDYEDDDQLEDMYLMEALESALHNDDAATIGVWLRHPQVLTVQACISAFVTAAATASADVSAAVQESGVTCGDFRQCTPDFMELPMHRVLAVGARAARVEHDAAFAKQASCH